MGAASDVVPLSTRDLQVKSGPEKRDRKLLLRADTEAERDEWVASIGRGIATVRDLDASFAQEHGEERHTLGKNISKELTWHLSIRRQKCWKGILIM